MTGNTRCAEDNLDRLIGQTMKDEVVYLYDLVGVVAQIYSARDRRSHLVSMVNGEREDQSCLYIFLTNMRHSKHIRDGL